MLTKIAGSIVQWYMGDNLLILIFNFLLLTLIWKAGFRYNQARESRPLWGALCALGTFALVVSGSFVWLFAFGGGGGLGGLGMVFPCAAGCFAHVRYLVLMRKTIDAFLGRQEDPLVYTKMTVAVSLILIISLIVMAAIG